MEDIKDLEGFEKLVKEFKVDSTEKGVEISKVLLEELLETKKHFEDMIASNDKEVIRKIKFVDLEKKERLFDIRYNRVDKKTIKTRSKMSPLNYRQFLINILQQLDITEEIFNEAIFFIKLGIDTSSKKVSVKYLKELFNTKRDNELRDIMKEFIEVFDYDYNMNRILLSLVDYKLTEFGKIANGDKTINLTEDDAEKKFV